MKLAFSTLGNPDWSFDKTLREAQKLGFEAIENSKYIKNRWLRWLFLFRMGKEMASGIDRCRDSISNLC